MTAIDARPAALEIALERGVTNPPGRSLIHGEDHWKCVALAGAWIAEQTPSADLEFILTFAALHDTMRENESNDPMHGPRAAQLLVGLLADPGVDYGRSLCGMQSRGELPSWADITRRAPLGQERLVRFRPQPLRLEARRG